MGAYTVNVKSPRFTAVPAARSAANVLRARLILVFSVLTLTCLSGVYASYSYLTFKPEYIDVLSAVPLAKSEATLVAQAYMDGTMPNLLYSVSVTSNMVDVISKYNFTKIEYVGPIVWSGFVRKDSIFAGDGMKVEIHEFRYMSPVSSVVDGVTTMSAKLMSLNVLMYISGDSLYPPALGALPSVGSEQTLRQIQEVLDYSVNSASLPAPALERINLWAKAWAGNDESTLKAVSGDTDVQTVNYNSVGAYSLESVTVLGATANADATIYVVRARVSLIGANGSILITDMDLTITRADTGLPNVSGWGPAGSGYLELDSVRVDN